MTNLSRRSFFGALAAAGAVAALPKPLRKAALAGGTSTVAIQSGTAAIKAGDVFTIAGVYSAGTRQLQQFRVIGAKASTISVERANV